MANRKINKEIKAFIKQRAAYSSDTAASIHRQVKDKFENPCSQPTVNKIVKSFRQGLADYKLVRTPSPLPDDEELADIRGQRWRRVPNESYAVYDQVVSMRQEIAELKEMIQLLGQVANLQADDSVIDAVGFDEFGLFYEDEEKDLTKDYIEKEEKNW